MEKERPSHSCGLYVHVCGMEECVINTGGPNVCVQCYVKYESVHNVRYLATTNRRVHLLLRSTTMSPYNITLNSSYLVDLLDLGRRWVIRRK